jgi:hypothetical protein
LKNSWSERYLLIPTYKSKIQNMLDAEEQNIKQEKENEKEKKKELKNNQIKYSKKIEEKQMFMMKIFNEKQKNKSLDEDLILRKNNNSKHPLMNNINNYCDSIREKLFIKNKSQDNIKQMTNNMKKIIKPSNIIKSEQENKSKDIKLPNLNDKINLKKYSIQKITNINKDKKNKAINTQKVGRNNNINKVKIDKTFQVEDVDYKGTNEINKLIERNGFNERTLELANCKLESIMQKQKEKSLLLKCEGGFEKNPGLGEEICDLLIDSMTAKLSLIKEIEKFNKVNIKIIWLIKVQDLMV